MVELATVVGRPTVSGWEYWRKLGRINMVDLGKATIDVRIMDVPEVREFVNDMQARLKVLETQGCRGLVDVDHVCHLTHRDCCRDDPHPITACGRFDLRARS